MLAKGQAVLLCRTTSYHKMVQRLSATQSYGSFRDEKKLYEVEVEQKKIWKIKSEDVHIRKHIDKPTAKSLPPDGKSFCQTAQDNYRTLFRALILKVFC